MTTPQDCLHDTHPPRREYATDPEGRIIEIVVCDECDPYALTDEQRAAEGLCSAEEQARFERELARRERQMYRMTFRDDRVVDVAAKTVAEAVRRVSSLRPEDLESVMPIAEFDRFRSLNDVMFDIHATVVEQFKAFDEGGEVDWSALMDVVESYAHTYRASHDPCRPVDVPAYK